MNVVLCRVLYTHALVAAPRLSLGWLRPRRGHDLRLTLRGAGRLATAEIVRPADGPPRAPTPTPGPCVTLTGLLREAGRAGS
jgi:hypothetical protein